MNRKSVQSLYTTVSYLRKYVDYAIRKGYVDTRINYFDLFRSTKMLYKYVDYRAENLVEKKHEVKLGKYIERDELHNIMNFCVNPQDSAIFAILFEGGYGVDLDELKNLKKSDFSLIERKITFTRDDNTKRTVYIEDEQVLYTIQDAIEQEIYEKTMEWRAWLIAMLLN